MSPVHECTPEIVAKKIKKSKLLDTVDVVMMEGGGPIDVVLKPTASRGEVGLGACHDQELLLQAASKHLSHPSKARVDPTQERRILRDVDISMGRQFRDKMKESPQGVSEAEAEEGVVVDELEKPKITPKDRINLRKKLDQISNAEVEIAQLSAKHSP